MVVVACGRGLATLITPGLRCELAVEVWLLMLCGCLCLGCCLLACSFWAWLFVIVIGWVVGCGGFGCWLGLIWFGFVACGCCVLLMFVGVVSGFVCCGV